MYIWLGDVRRERGLYNENGFRAAKYASDLGVPSTLEAGTHLFPVTAVVWSVCVVDYNGPSFPLLHWGTLHHFIHTEGVPLLEAQPRRNTRSWPALFRRPGQQWHHCSVAVFALTDIRYPVLDRAQHLTLTLATLDMAVLTLANFELSVQNSGWEMTRYCHCPDTEW